MATTTMNDRGYYGHHGHASSGAHRGCPGRRASAAEWQPWHPVACGAAPHVDPHPAQVAPYGGVRRLLPPSACASLELSGGAYNRPTIYPEGSLQLPGPRLQSL